MIIHDDVFVSFDSFSIFISTPLPGCPSPPATFPHQPLLFLCCSFGPTEHPTPLPWSLTLASLPRACQCQASSSIGSAAPCRAHRLWSSSGCLPPSLCRQPPGWLHSLSHSWLWKGPLPGPPGLLFLSLQNHKFPLIFFPVFNILFSMVLISSLSQILYSCLLWASFLKETHS